jgi:hypothetical protein
LLRQPVRGKSERGSKRENQRVRETESEEKQLILGCCDREVKMRMRQTDQTITTQAERLTFVAAAVPS